MDILIYSQSRKTADAWLPNFRRFFRQKGCRVFDIHGARGGAVWILNQLIPQMDHVFVWNGNRKFDRLCISLCQENDVPYSIMESGFFPQRGYYTLDKKGVNAKSQLMEDDLSWVSDEHFAKLQALRIKYLGTKRYKGEGNYILAPLQLDGDSSIVLHSPYKTMQDFIDHAEARFPDRKIIFKAHPLDKKYKDYKVSGKNSLINKGNILDLAADAEHVYGINSTTLLESALLGAPVTSVGDGFLKQHANHVERILAALADMQIPIEESDISYWLERYTAFSWHAKKRSSGIPLRHRLYYRLFRLRHLQLPKLL